ncbi:High mobility group protein B3 [Galemys pyrenaicus]|uniref:High mobility group protein B3 n=1 Tax=Galemys pyrenaicus TaxID=202257 RepID=A0A8J6AZD3_GALPY|nr:High mobility group protein B3 [Galemys pyrenaicus]
MGRRPAQLRPQFDAAKRKRWAKRWAKSRAKRPHATPSLQDPPQNHPPTQFSRSALTIHLLVILRGKEAGEIRNNLNDSEKQPCSKKVAKLKKYKKDVTGYKWKEKFDGAKSPAEVAREKVEGGGEWAEGIGNLTSLYLCWLVSTQGCVRAEVIKRKRQLSRHLGRQALGTEPDGPNSRESGRRHFSIDCSGLGEGPTTKATAAAAAAEPWVGVCALESEAQAEASAVAGAPAVDGMTTTAILP